MYRVLDLVRAREKAAGEWSTASIAKRFREEDKDASGTISPEEMMQTLTNMGIHLSVEDLRILIDENDTDGDGTLDYVEAAQAVENLLANFADKAEGEKSKVVGLASLALLLLTMLGFSAILTGQSEALIDPTQKWGFGESIYFLLITSTTVGLGDFHPSIPVPESIILERVGNNTEDPLYLENLQIFYRLWCWYFIIFVLCSLLSALVSAALDFKESLNSLAVRHIQGERVAMEDHKKDALRKVKATVKLSRSATNLLKPSGGKGTIVLSPVDKGTKSGGNPFALKVGSSASSPANKVAPEPPL